MTDDHLENESKGGYRRPPKKNQFKPGQSGNPSGRPKRKKPTLDYHEAVHEVASKPLPVTVNGRPASISRWQAFVSKTYASALQGDPRAASILLRIMKQYPPPSENPVEVSNPIDHGVEVRRRIEELAKRIEEDAIEHNRQDPKAISKQGNQGNQGA